MRGVIRRFAAAATVAAFTAIVPAGALAQAPSTPANPGRVASINPFVLLFGYFSGEYEHRVRPTLAIAVAGSSAEWGIDDQNDRRTNIDLKARLYPSEKALQGLGLAAGVGYTRMKREDYYYAECNPFGDCVTPVDCRIDSPCMPTETTRTFSAPSFSIEFTYQWLLGRQKATAFTVGFGAKRAFTSAEKWGFHERITPTGKLNVGYAF
jgi:hypothetical protein